MFGAGAAPGRSPAGSPAPAPACRPALILSQMRTASGGNRWNVVSQISLDAGATVAGLHGTAQFEDDLTQGRYARRFQIAIMGPTAEVYDGSTLWSQDISGGVHPFDSAYAKQQAITNAFLARRGYLDPHTDARLTCVATSVAGRPAIVIRVQPKGGSPAELTIDPQTYLLARISKRNPLETSILSLADYRQVDGVVLPFSISSGTPSNPTDDYAITVRRYDLHRQARGDFSKPVPPNDMRMIGGAASTTVPMMLEGHQLMIWASINGHEPMPFILDTGGHAILTPLAAQTLGLHGTGAGESGGSGPGKVSTQYTRVKSLRIGNAELLDQPFLIIPYPYSFYERGKKTPLAGIIGLEFFERYAARIDYGDRTVTFTPLPAFRYRGRGAAVPFTFETESDMPMVNAAADGHPGLFGVDTGNGGNLILFGGFLNETGLLAQYAPGTLLIGQGTGGTNTAHLETLRRFTIADQALHEIPASFTQMKSGAFAAWTQAGNMGLSVLSQFIPTFDYASQTLYLDRANRPTRFGKNRTGIAFEKNGPDAFDVLLVRPNSVGAAAGIVAGDKIVAVNGKSASDYSWADLIAIVTQPAGTPLRLRVSHEGTVRDIAIVLR
jgi:hypothetical protein